METKTAGFEELKGGLAGTLVEPREEGWDDARSAWNLIADQRPAAVVYAEGAEDVVAAIGFARGNGLRVAAQGTGHGAGSRGPLADAVLVRTERMKAIDVDAERRVGRFEAGVIWSEAAEATAAHGLAVLSGSAPDVGVVGYSTGGGFGWLARRHGLACNSIRAAEIVTADGELRRVDAEHEPELFWALRGGGGNFGVITALEFDLVELSEVFAGSVIYPADERSGEILEAYRRWTATVPDEVTSIARFLRLPPFPEVPEPLRDRPVITLGACYASPAEEGAQLIAPLRELGEPIMDLFEAMPPTELMKIHMEPEEPVPAGVFTTSLAALPATALEAFVEVAGPGSGSPLLVAELRHAGGALQRAAEGAGARATLDGEFVFCGIGVPTSPESGEAITAHIDAVCAALEPWAAERRYFNFADRKVSPSSLFDAETLGRLRDVKRFYDPNHLLDANHMLAE